MIPSILSHMPRPQRQENDNNSLSSSLYSSSKSSQEFSRQNSYDFQDAKLTSVCDTIVNDLPVQPLTPPPYWSHSRSQSQSSQSSAAPARQWDDERSSRSANIQHLLTCEKPLPPLPGKSAGVSMQKPLPPLPRSRPKRSTDDIYFCLKEFDD